MKRPPCRLLLLLSASLPLLCPAASLVVIEDRGGASALPYYQDLVPEPQSNDSSQSPLQLGVRGGGAFPVQSTQLTPGVVQGRVINAPGLQPLFVIGDDQRSRQWLMERRPQLLQLQAVGLVINVPSEERFAEVKRWADGLQVVPTPADELASRLGLRHYPALITPTAIQQ